MRKVRPLIIVALLVSSLLEAAPASAAAVIKVTKLTDDTPNGCSKTDCSLREAVLKSNQTKDVVEKIVLSADTYSLMIAGTDEDAAATGDLDITRPVKIVGVTQETIIEQNATPDDRIFHVLQKGTLALTGVNVTGGSVSGSGGGILATAGRRVTLRQSALSLNAAGFNGLGGGIATSGPLKITDSFVQFNTSGGGAGGVSSFGAPNTITRSHISGNTTLSNNGTGGGGIYHQERFPLTIVDSTIEGNTAGGNGGGGVLVFGGTTKNAPFEMLRSTVSDNTSSGNGGGMNITRFGNASFGIAQIRIDDSTISGNSADIAGGGLWCGCPSDEQAGILPASMTHTTVVHNTADADNDDDVAGGGEGGGVALVGHQMEVLASIIGDNNDPGDPNDEDCGAFALASLGSNVTTEPDPGIVFPNRGCFYGVPLDPTDTIVGTLDFIGPLQDNGGPTETHALLDLTATATDRHEGAGCSGTDQRGVPRPFGDACDSGAYEFALCDERLVTIVGTPGRDTIDGTSDSDGILGLGGNDTIDGAGDHDSICGGRGNDKISGGDGMDSLFGEAGDDRLDGGADTDGCVGGPGKDKIVNCE